MRMRELFTIAEDEGKAPIKPSTPRKDSYQSKPPKRTRYQDGSDGWYQEPPPPAPKLKSAPPAKPTAST